MVYLAGSAIWLAMIIYHLNGFSQKYSFRWPLFWAFRTKIVKMWAKLLHRRQSSMNLWRMNDWVWWKRQKQFRYVVRPLQHLPCAVSPIRAHWALWLATWARCARKKRKLSRKRLSVHGFRDVSFVLSMPASPVFWWPKTFSMAWNEWSLHFLLLIDFVNL